MSSVKAYTADAPPNAYRAMPPPVSLDELAARGDPAELNTFITERPDQADALKTALARTNASALFYLEQENSTSNINSDAPSKNRTETSPRTARFGGIENLDPVAMTQVGDVVVTGTKKPKLGLDDVPGGGGGGGGGGSGGISPGGGSGPPKAQDAKEPEKQCGPDQQARDAAKKFLDAAAAEGQHVAYRERGAYILRNDDGSYRLSGYAEGIPMGGAVSPAIDEITPSNLVGMIHNHPGGGATASGPDRQIITDWQNYITRNGGSAEFRMYIMSNDGKIYVYDVDNMNEELSSLEISGGC